MLASLFGTSGFERHFPFFRFGVGDGSDLFRFKLFLADRTVNMLAAFFGTSRFFLNFPVASRMRKFFDLFDLFLSALADSVSAARCGATCLLCDLPVAEDVTFCVKFFKFFFAATRANSVLATLLGASGFGNIPVAEGVTERGDLFGSRLLAANGAIFYSAALFKTGGFNDDLPFACGVSERGDLFGFGFFSANGANFVFHSLFRTGSGNGNFPFARNVSESGNRSDFGFFAANGAKSVLNALCGASGFGNDDPSSAGGMSERGNEIILHGFFATRTMINAVTVFRTGRIDFFDEFALSVTERRDLHLCRIIASFMRTNFMRFPTDFCASRRFRFDENDIVSDRGSASGLLNFTAFGTKYGFYAFLNAGGIDDIRPFRRRRVREFSNSLIGRMITTRAGVVRFPTEFGTGRLLPVVVDKVVSERSDLHAVEFFAANGTKQRFSSCLGASRLFGLRPFGGFRVGYQSDIFAFKFNAANGAKQRHSTVFGTSGFFGHHPFACRSVSERGKNGGVQIVDLVFAGFVQEVQIAMRVEPICHIAVFGTSRSDGFGLDDRAEFGEVNGYGADLQILLRTEGYVVRIDIFHGDRITVVGNDNIALVYI